MEEENIEKYLHSTTLIKYFPPWQQEQMEMMVMGTVILGTCVSMRITKQEPHGIKLVVILMGNQPIIDLICLFRYLNLRTTIHWLWEMIMGI